MAKQTEKKSIWAFGTKQVVYAAIGAALYAVLTWAFNVWQIPGAGNVGIRPAIVIPMFFGIAFGPIVGFITGFVGNILADMLSGYGFWIWWDLGNGIIGLIPGLFSALIVKYDELNPSFGVNFQSSWVAQQAWAWPVHQNSGYPAQILIPSC